MHGVLVWPIEHPPSSSGLCSWSMPGARVPDSVDHESGQVAATATAVFHAGLMGELLWAGLPWIGPIYYPEQQDFQNAEAMLRPRFGRQASCGHAYGQRVALHVLSTRWARVCEVAERLVADGRWAPAACLEGGAVVPRALEAAVPFGAG